MSKWLSHCVTPGLLFVLAGMTTQVARAQNDVTFQVNMKIKMLEGTFQPQSGDIVRVAGSMNDWGNSVDTLSDGNGDSIYTKTISLATGGVTYKYLKTLRGGLDWEGGSDRPYTVVDGPQSAPLVYFDNDSVFTPAANVPVTFQVNMRVKILEGTFQPGSGDVVRVAGSINDWGNSTDTLTDGNSDSVYTKTIQLLEGTNAQYKFLKTPRGGSDWEDGDNRVHIVPNGGGDIPVAYFNYDSVVNTPVSANILWQVDMTGFQQIGWFSPAVDSVQVRGGFNGWGGTALEFDPLSTGSYFVTLPYTGTSGDQIAHKYFMDLDSATAVVRFPGWEDPANRDGVGYDHPMTRGDGNRLFSVPGSGNQPVPQYWYSDINPNGLLLNNTDSVTVTIRVNMGPATRYIIPFTPGIDTVILQWQDQTWRRDQLRKQATFASSIVMSPEVGGGDSVYQVSFLVVGRSHYGMMYNYRFAQPGGTTVDEGGGLGAQNLFRSRYIAPLAPNSFPRFYTTPLDQWQKDVPLPAEVPPFPILAGVSADPTPGIPAGFTLGQNYPNPFNPTTNFKYSIAEKSRVILKVFNLLGQEVATLLDQEQPVGSYVVKFEATALPTGVYFYRLEAGKYIETRKMLLLK